MVSSLLYNELVNLHSKEYLIMYKDYFIEILNYQKKI